MAVFQQTQDDPLANFNISYQQRRAGESVQQTLMEKVRAGKWLLILGRTGLGKTREVAELAQAHSQEGWTVMRLENHELLIVPSNFPIDRLDRQPRLLFVLDNLNQAMWLGSQLSAVDDSGKRLEPLKSPMQKRLLETLQFYMNYCGAQKVRVAATARNEMHWAEMRTQSPPVTKPWPLIQMLH